VPRRLTHAYWIEVGTQRERARVFKLWEAEMKCPCEEPMQHLKKELENPMSSITWVVGPNGEPIPYNIKTDAGKRLWIYLNNQHGAGTWGLAGELIPLIEKEAQERAIALYELQRLAEETGEHENFDNPLIDNEKEKQKVQDYIELLGIIDK
jgi:hypothetical protein